MCRINFKILSRYVLINIILYNILLAQSLSWLGTLGGNKSYAYAVSDNGVVAGTSNNIANETRAFRWTKTGGMQDLGALIVYTYTSYARDISSDGTVITGTSFHAFRWTESSGMQDLGSLDTTTSPSFADAISYDGSTIVGSSEAKGGGYFTSFIWTENDGMNQLHDQVVSNYAFGISGDGNVIVGSIAHQNALRAFKWTESTGIQDLGTLGGSESRALSANEDGSVIVGYATNSSDNKRPFRWKESTGMVELPTLGTESEALDVSGNGRYVVGYYIINGTQERRAIRWDAFTFPPSVRNLTSYYSDLLTTGSYLEMATAISPSGRYIVGYGYNAETKRTEAFLLDTELPSTIGNIGNPPELFELFQNYPNPFNPTTTITYNLRMTNRVSLTIYNSLGEKVRTLVNRQQSPGRYEVVWDGRDDSGQLVTSGVYLYKLEAGKFNQAKKMILVR